VVRYGHAVNYWLLSVTTRVAILLRQVRNTGRGEERQKVVEVVVAPGRQITPDLLLVMATGYHNLANFFDRPGGGP